MRSFVSLTVAAISLCPLSRATAQQVQVWNNPWNSSYTAGESILTDTQYLELADDFEVSAELVRIVAWGTDDGCFICPPPTTTGVYVRFYEWTDGGPGSLQREYFLPEGDPGLLHGIEPARVEVLLPEPFTATGRHFVSVQVSFAPEGSWSWWMSNRGAPTLLSVRGRNSPSAPWTTLSDFAGAIHGDVAFELYGIPEQPPPDEFDPCGEWQVTPTPNPPNPTQAVLTDVGVVDENNVWAVGAVVVPYNGDPTDNIRLTYVLHWDGETWTQVPSPSPTECDECTWAGLTSIGVVSTDDIWAAGNARVRNGHLELGSHAMIQRWDGDSWQVAAIPDLGGGSGGSIADIEVVAPDNVWFVGTPPPPPAAPQPALAMRWNGSDFEFFDVPIVNFDTGRDAGNPLNAIDALAPDDMWAVGSGNINAEGEQSQIHRFDGQQWTHVPGPLPGYFNALFAVEAIAPDDVWAGGEYWDVDGIFGFLIHWDGTGWTQVDAPGIIFDLHAFGPDDIYAVGGAVWHYDGVSWTVVESFPELSYPSLSRMDDVRPCELWLAGRHYVGGGQVTLAAHLVPRAFVVGDVNCDGHVNNFDIDAFVRALTNEADYEQAHAGCDRLSADTTGDGEVNNFDIDPFVELLIGE